MEYSINQLAKLAGVTTRTLRYYDQIGLLSPQRISSNGYRIYGQQEVDLLQQILLYREMEVPLDEIKNMVWAKDYNRSAALDNHLLVLQEKKERLERLIANVEKTIAAAKGEIKMSDKEKFEGFKQKIVEENDQRYGKEIREKYGDDVVDASNSKLLGLTGEQYKNLEHLAQQIKDTLKAAFHQSDPAGELARQVCDLHKQWLCYYWKTYSKEAHLGLASMYVADARFKKYYDDIEEGCAEFLVEALKIYCRE